MNNANLSDFTYHVNAVGGEPVLVIEDLNRGGRSVTNNMEAILHSIADDTGINLENAKIVYRDSEGTYDGVRLTMGGNAQFFSPAKGLRITDEAEAVRHVRNE